MSSSCICHALFLLQDRSIMNLITVEVGGINTFAPLPVVTGQKTGLGLLDGSGVDRSVPKLQMFLPFIYGALFKC